MNVEIGTKPCSFFSGNTLIGSCVQCKEVVLSCLVDVFLLFDSPHPKETQYCLTKNAKTNFMLPVGGGGDFCTFNM